jgi:hypothetical protein
MRPIFNILALSLFAHAVSSTSVILPRDPRGGGRSGGTRGGVDTTGGGTGGGTDVTGGTGGTGGSHDGDTSSSGSTFGGNGRTADTSTYHQGTTTSAGTGRGKSGDTGDDAIPSYSLDSTDRDANFFSGGGGGRFTLPGDSTFAGRQVGGGRRSEVLGTRSYGSGYPYTSGDVRTQGVAGQPFPFGFWPLYWYGWGRSFEYGGNATIEWDRPGDSQVIVKLVPSSTPTTAWSNTTLGNNTLYMIGDGDSVTTLLTLLIDPHDYYSYGCSVSDLAVVDMSWYSPPPIQFDNVIQWYRSSSFALAFDGYNNSYAVAPLNATAGVDWSDSTPLPATLASSPFLDCINKTILAALPIIDAEPPFSLPLGAIIGIVVGSLSGLLGLVMCVCCCLRVKRAVKAQRAAGPASASPESPPNATTQTQFGAPPVFRFPGSNHTATSERQPMLGFPEPSMLGPPSSHSSVSGSQRGSIDSAKTPGPEQPPAYGQHQPPRSSVQVLYVQRTFVVQS